MAKKSKRCRAGFSTSFCGAAIASTLVFSGFVSADQNQYGGDQYDSENLSTTLQRYARNPSFSNGLDREFFLELVAQAPCDTTDLVAAIHNDRARASCERYDEDCQNHWGRAVINACMFPMTDNLKCKEIDGKNEPDRYELCILNVISRETYFPWWRSNNGQDGEEDRKYFPTLADFQAFADGTAGLLLQSYPTVTEINQMTDVSMPDRGRLRTAVSFAQGFEKKDEYLSNLCSKSYRSDIEISVCKYSAVRRRLSLTIENAGHIYALID